MWVEPVGATTARVERRLLLAEGGRRRGAGDRRLASARARAGRRHLCAGAALHTAGLDAAGCSPRPRNGACSSCTSTCAALAVGTIESQVRSALDTAPVTRPRGQRVGADGSRSGRWESSTDDIRCCWHRPDDRVRRVLLVARAFGMRQDDDAADDRRLRADRDRLDPHRRRRHGRCGAGTAAGQHRLPEHALFPHQTVEQNVGFGMRFQDCSKQERSRRVGEALDWFASPASPGAARTSSPAVSSGAALHGRSCVPRCCCSTSRWARSMPSLPPCSSSKELHREVGITFVYVTHDQEEALTMSDRLAVMNDGEIEQIGAPRRSTTRPSRSTWPTSWGSPT